MAKEFAVAKIIESSESLIAWNLNSLWRADQAYWLDGVYLATTDEVLRSDSEVRRPAHKENQGHLSKARESGLSGYF